MPKATYTASRGESTQKAFDIDFEGATIQCMMLRLHEFARGLGLDETATRRIVEKVVADMPLSATEERLSAAVERMILVAA